MSVENAEKKVLELKRELEAAQGLIDHNEREITLIEQQLFREAGRLKHLTSMEEENVRYSLFIIISGTRGSTFC